VSVGAHRAGPGLDHVRGLFWLFLQDAARGEQMLTDRTGDIKLVDRALEELVLEKNFLAGQDAEVELIDRLVDGIGNKHLLRRGPLRIGPARRATARGNHEQAHDR
jgi:hypothetical protein